MVPIMLSFLLLVKTIARGEYPPRAIPSSLNSKNAPR